MARNKYGKAESAAAEWNRRHPVGTLCRYWRGVREGEGLIGRTSCEAFALGTHTASVIFDGKGGAIALTHVEPLDEKERAQHFIDEAKRKKASEQ